MTAVYCRHKEGNAEICDSCREFADYACQRLDHCRYGDTKPPCRRCPAHCYSPAMRERIRRVMRYAWPRELMRAPLSALRHMF